MAQEFLNGVAVTGNITQDGNKVLDVGDMTEAQAARIKANPRIFDLGEDTTGAVTGDLRIVAP